MKGTAFVERAAALMIVTLPLIGFALTVNLAAATYGGVAPICPLASGCSALLHHPAGRLLGVPVAYFGVVAYGTLIFVGLRKPPWRRRSIGYGLSAAYSVVSVCLLFRSHLLVGFICSSCLMSTLLFCSTSIAYAHIRDDIELRSGLGLVVGIAAVFGSVSWSAHALIQGPHAIAHNSAELHRVSGDVLAPGLAPSFGPDRADRIVVVFSSLSCFACKTSLPSWIQWAKTQSDTRFVFRHLPISRNADSDAAALAAHLHGEYWQYCGIMWGAESTRTEQVLLALERLKNGEECIRMLQTGDMRMVSALEQDVSLAKRLAIEVVPVAIVVTRKGRWVVGLPGVKDILERDNRLK